MRTNNLWNPTTFGIQQPLESNDVWKPTHFGIQRPLETNALCNPTTFGNQQPLEANNVWKPKHFGNQQTFWNPTKPTNQPTNQPRPCAHPRKVTRRKCTSPQSKARRVPLCTSVLQHARAQTDVAAVAFKYEKDPTGDVQFRGASHP